MYTSIKFMIYDKLLTLILVLDIILPILMFVVSGHMVWTVGWVLVGFNTFFLITNLLILVYIKVKEDKRSKKRHESLF